MKHSRSVVILFVLLGAALALVTCNLGYNIPSGALQYISQSQLDTLKNMGIAINEGLTPPNMEGMYYCNSLVRTGGNIPNDSLTTFGNLSLKFYNQASDNSVMVSYDQNSGGEIGNGLGSFVSGTGNNFTVFSQITGTSSGINFKDAYLFSGTIAADGIHNFVYALLMTQKDPDPSEYLINVGEGRVISESDGLAAATTTYP